MDRKSNHSLYIKAVIIGLLPFVSALIYCLLQNKNLFNIYYPASDWNDELIYYKQIEGMVAYGIPKGYFGFNESHARLASFAAWSPALYLPWSIPALLTGWNIYTPVIMNITYISIALALFVLLTKPTKKQFCALVALCFLYKSNTRYMLALMPEMICQSFIIVILGLAVSYQREKKSWKLILMCVLAIYATWMRPYLILFLLLPLWILCSRHKKKGIFCSIVILSFTIAVYGLISHYLQADYVVPLYSTDWLSFISEGGIIRGGIALIQYIISQIKDYLSWMLLFLLSGRPEGGYFIVFSLLLLLGILQLVNDLRSIKSLKNQGNTKAIQKIYQRLPIVVHMLFSFIAMFFALILMYRFQEGGKHLLIFIAAGTLMMCINNDEKDLSKAFLLIPLFIAVFWIRMTPYAGNQIPVKNEYAIQKQAYWSEMFQKNIQLCTDNTPTYDNTILWVLNDYIDDQKIQSDWTVLYAFPKGMGINCVQFEYVINNYSSLQSRYILMPKGGYLEAFCIACGYNKLGDDGTTVVYDRL